MSSRIVQRVFGGPEALEVVEVPTPTVADLGPTDVLVAVAAAGVNPVDVTTREGRGMAAAGIITLPFTPGWDVAGRVEAVGTGVTGLEAGQRVLGLARFPHEGGGYAQHVVVPAEDLIATPERLNDEQAGALPMAAMTAWQAFADTTSVGPGQRVLITGAGGGVGHLAVQIAKHLGAHVVAVASEGKHDWLKSLGADEVVDYRDTAAVAALEGTVDVALSLAAGSREAALRAVRQGGTLVAPGRRGGRSLVGRRGEEGPVRRHPRPHPARLARERRRPGRRRRVGTGGLPHLRPRRRRPGAPRPRVGSHHGEGRPSPGGCIRGLIRHDRREVAGGFRPRPAEG